MDRPAGRDNNFTHLLKGPSRVHRLLSTCSVVPPRANVRMRGIRIRNCRYSAMMEIVRHFAPPRNALLPLVAALWAVTANAGATRSYEFDVLLDAKSIGTHRFEISSADDGEEQVRSEASFNVRILGVTAYRYRHGANERWSGGCLVRIDAKTQDNGRSLVVRGGRELEGFRLETPALRLDADCVASYAYWNPRLLLAQRSLLNPQTGEFDVVRIERSGRESLLVLGRTMIANRYRLTGPQFVIDLWYDEAGKWLQLESSTSSKRMLRYRLRS
jgi:hypothetical protein